MKWMLRNGFDVFYCCLDGSECNRSFIKLHFKDVDPVIKHFTTVNPHTWTNFVFIMDPEVQSVLTKILFNTVVCLQFTG